MVEFFNRACSHVGLTCYIFLLHLVHVLPDRVSLCHSEIPVKNPARGHKVEKKHHSEGKNVRRTVLSIQRENGNGTKNTRKKRHLKKNKKKHVWLSGRLHIEGRLNEGPWLQRKNKDENEAKQNKRKTEKDVMTSANQMPGGHKFAPLVASQQDRANQHEPACFGRSSPWSLPSRPGIPLHAVVQP